MRNHSQIRFAYKQLLDSAKAKKTTKQCVLGARTCDNPTKFVSPLRISRNVFHLTACVLIQSVKVGTYQISKFETTLGKRNSRVSPDLNLVPYTLYPLLISNLHAVIRFSPVSGKFGLIVKSKNCIDIDGVSHVTDEEATLNNGSVMVIKDIRMLFEIKV